MSIDAAKCDHSLHPALHVVVSGSGAVWTVTFSGVGVNNATLSIGDGEYSLVLSGIPGLSRSTYDFFRLLGDMDGDGTVSASDFSTLISTFLRPPGDPLYLGADDFDGDNTIGASDLSQFTANFLHTVPTPLPELTRTRTWRLGLPFGSVMLSVFAKTASRAA